MHLSIYKLLNTQAKKTPNAYAILAPNCLPLTYGQLYQQMKYVKDQLNTFGIGRNDRVAIIVPNGPELATAFISVTASATSAPLNINYTASEFEFYLTDANVKTLLILKGFDSPARNIAHKHNIPIIELIPTLNNSAGLFSLTGTPKSLSTPGGFAEVGDTALVLHTSGTTSQPKLVPLTQANLCHSAQNHINTLKLTPGDRCLNVMPLFHIHGLITAILSSLASGASIVCTPGFYGAETFEWFNWLKEFKPTWYTSAPPIHLAVLEQAKRNPDIIKQHTLRFIRSAAAPLPPQIMAQIEEMFGIPVIESYGMTEAAAQITSNPLPPRKRKAGSVGPAAGPEVCILDQEGNILPQGQTGEIAIQGENITPGYDHNPRVNTEAFVGHWLRTGDQGYLDKDNYLFITGRIKELINRGGEKISPREVDEALLNHPEILEAVTFAIADPELGEEIGTAVVLRNNTLTEKDLRQFASQYLVDYKVPKRFIIVDKIPKGATGKPQRVGLAEKLGITSDQTVEQKPDDNFIAPRDVLELQLTKIWESVLNIQPISIRDNFFDLGGHSMLALHLFDQISSVIHKDLPLGTLFDAPTIEELANIIRQEDWSPQWSSLTAIRAGGKKLPLYMVPPSGTTALCFSDLVNHLEPGRPIYALNPLGMDGDQTPHETIEEMAAHYLQEIRELQPKGPYLLLGRCFGGHIILEMAQQLHKIGETVPFIMLLDPAAPSNGPTWQYDPDKQPPKTKVPLSRYINRFFHHLFHGSLAKTLRRRLRRKKRKIDQVKNTIVPGGQKVNHTYQAHIKAKRRYMAKPYDGKMFLIQSEQFANKDHRDKWEILAIQGIDYIVIPDTTHLTLLNEEEYTKTTAEYIEKYLRELEM